MGIRPAKFCVLATILSLISAIHLSFKDGGKHPSEILLHTDSLRKLYERPVSEWPKPNIDSGVVWLEFSAITGLDKNTVSEGQKPAAILGKYLFFDPILSGSNQISCSSCHNPQTAWADKLTVSIGNDHESGNRNSISLLNVTERKTFFWDGRAATLEDQIISPIEAHNEMAMEAKKLPHKLQKIKAYRKLFKEAFGTEKITYELITKALVSFEGTIKSRRNRFDNFIEGKYDQLTDQEIQGLDLFRGKARCMNCHNGPYFTDENFHNIGLTYYKRKYEDLGRYNVTNNPEDIGRFRTASLRDVMNTSPWMHNGLFDNIIGIINIYNSGMQMNTATPEQKATDPLYPITDPLMKKLNLSGEEKQAIVSFLNAITGTQYKMPRPNKLPRD